MNKDILKGGLRAGENLTRSTRSKIDLKSISTSQIVDKNPLEEIERPKNRTKSIQTDLIVDEDSSAMGSGGVQPSGVAIETEVSLHPANDEFVREESSDDEGSQTPRVRKSGRLIVERTFEGEEQANSNAQRKVREEEDSAEDQDDLMQQIGGQP